MTHQRPLLGLFAVCLLVGVDAAGAQAQTPTPAAMMALRPHNNEVSYTIPTAQELTQCKVEAIRTGGRGWMVTDGQGRILRRFVDTNNDNKLDLWCYYKDGVEVYREIDSRTPGTGIPDQFRWINEGGMKWGIDTAGKGKIDAWRMISSEEVAQEVFFALTARDFARFRALMISEAELRSLKLSPSQLGRVQDFLAKAQAKFIETANGIKAGAQFLQVEPAVPQCIPGDSVGTENDQIHYPFRRVLYQGNGPGGPSHEFLQTDGMIRVGSTWRMAGDITDTGEVIIDIVRKILDEIAKMDEKNPPPPRAATVADVACLLRRAAKIEELLTHNPPQAESCWEQLLDNLGAVAYKERADSLLAPPPVKDGPGMTRLGQLKTQLTDGRKGSNLAGHATFVELCARFLPVLESERAMNDLKKVQEDWHDGLTKFVTDYPNVKDTPDALNYLAIGAEFAGKDEEAKRWYRLIYTNFPAHALAPKSRGCVRRLEAIGQPMELASPTLDGRNNFDISSLKGKVVAVYYWASYCQSCPREFAVLKQLQGAMQSKGLELVCVNLDDNQADAVRFLTANPLPGIHLFQAKTDGGGVGLNGPLAVHYGINGLPTLFLIGRDGKVVNNSLQAFDLQNAVNKQL